MIKMIFAVAANGAFSVSDNTLPWKHIPEDMKYFNKYTQGSVVVMGRKTWESLPKSKLPGRVCIVLSSSLQLEGDVQPEIVANSLQEALALAVFIYPEHDVCVIGGSQLLAYASKLVDEISITVISTDHLKTPDWTKEIHYLDAPLIMMRATESKQLSNFTTIDIGTGLATVTLIN